MDIEDLHQMLNRGQRAMGSELGSVFIPLDSSAKKIYQNKWSAPDGNDWTDAAKIIRLIVNFQQNPDAEMRAAIYEYVHVHDWYKVPWATFAARIDDP